MLVFHYEVETLMPGHLAQRVACALYILRNSFRGASRSSEARLLTAHDYLLLIYPIFKVFQLLMRSQNCFPS